VTTVSDAERRRRLAVRHALVPSRRANTVTEAIEAVVALHSSDPTSVFLSAAARMRSPTPRTIETALYEDRVAFRHHAMRRTIWVMTPPVAQAAHAGFARKIALAERRRTTILFGEDEAWVADGIDRVVEAVRSADGPIGARAVGAAVPDLAEPRVVNAGKPYEGTMAPHTRLLLCAAFEGRIARGRPAGTWIGSQYMWLPSEAWHSIDWSEPDELTGATAVIHRYLDRFGPATLDDVGWWTGATKTLVRRSLDRLGAMEVRLEDGTTGFVAPDDPVDRSSDDPSSDQDPGPWVALLPGLDPSAMGWKGRAWYLDPEVAVRVTDRNGNIGPTLWVDGRVLGGWVQRPDGSIAHDAAGLTRSHRALLDVEIERLRAFVGETRFSVRFPSPNQRDLLA
jgi:hypothetical protein